MSQNKRGNVSQRQPQINTTLATSAHYSGPIPLPSHMAQYEEILPGSADRLLRMAEESQRSAIDVNKMEYELNSKLLRASLIMDIIGKAVTFFLIIILLVSAVYFLKEGHPVTGIATLFCAIGGAAYSNIKKK